MCLRSLILFRKCGEFKKDFHFIKTLVINIYTVKPVHSGHLRFRKNCPLCTGVRYIEVFILWDHCHNYLKGRNFGGSQKWRNLAEFNLADHEKIKFWREFNLADRKKHFCRSILTKEKVQQKAKSVVEID